ncbi:hypothetical protein B6U91_01135 [Candidatus Pacearchaeota archaeon ex4484_71]|nr:MAG: hypothetical protein B6U91_01135 [Candidatus Pacearchaeota archaeon ex4484_71]
MKIYADSEKYDVYVICPVRGAEKSTLDFLEKYKHALVKKGAKVLLPTTDTNQDDPSGGYNIVESHLNEMYGSREAHILWNKNSGGSKVDLGSVLIENARRGMKILLINRGAVEEMVRDQRENGIFKSYEMVLLKLDEEYDGNLRLGKRELESLLE